MSKHRHKPAIKADLQKVYDRALKEHWITLTAPPAFLVHVLNLADVGLEAMIKAHQIDAGAIHIAEESLEQLSIQLVLQRPDYKDELAVFAKNK